MKEITIKLTGAEYKLLQNACTAWGQSQDRILADSLVCWLSNEKDIDGVKQAFDSRQVVQYQSQAGPG